MSTFGDVTYQENPAEVQGGTASSSSSPAIDPNDPRLTSESLTDSGADAYAVPSPLPDGKWRAKAKQVDINDDRKQLQRYAVFSRPKMAGGTPFFATNVEFSIIDHAGKFDGVKLTEYWVKTLIDERKGTSQAATLTRKLGGKTPGATTQKGAIELLLLTLAAEPELIVETAWSAECQTCQETAKKKGDRAPRPFLQGMHRFPATKIPGEHDPMVKCSACGAMVRAQARINGFFALSETQATRGNASK